jgi:acyl dehydratase
MPDVFAHGMLGMAWLGRLLTNWAPQSGCAASMRFQGITHLANAISCTGRVAEKRDADRSVRIEVQSTNQHDQTKIAGDAWISLP